MATPTMPSPIRTQAHQGIPLPESLEVVERGLTATVVLFPVIAVVWPGLVTVVVAVTVRLCAGFVIVFVSVVPVFVPAVEVSLALDVALAASA